MGKLDSENSLRFLENANRFGLFFLPVGVHAQMVSTLVGKLAFLFTVLTHPCFMRVSIFEASPLTHLTPNLSSQNA